MKHALIPYHFEAILEKFPVPSSEHLPYLDERTKVAIANAWEAPSIRYWITIFKMLEVCNEKTTLDFQNYFIEPFEIVVVLDS